MAEEEAAKKRGGGREAEIRPEDVRFADYRKKEMVFLPKKKRLPLGKAYQKTQITEAKAQKRIIEMQETITVQDFANQLSVKAIGYRPQAHADGPDGEYQLDAGFRHRDIGRRAEYKYEVRNIAFNEAAADR